MRKIHIIALAAIAALAFASAATAAASVTLSPLFSDHMVLQRGKAVPIYGTASPGEKVSVAFAGQTVSATADRQGNWQVMLAPMAACTTGQTLTITSAISNQKSEINDVVVGDVWLCSGQSNMDMTLNGCDRKEDVDGATFPGIRSFRVPGTAAGSPSKTLHGNPSWAVCGPGTAGGFSATAFYFARKIYLDNKAAIPIGLLVSSVGGTPIDVWLVPEGLVGIPAIQPLLSQPVLPGGPFNLANGMIHPLAPYGIKGAIWYQGENAERSVQSPDSYFLKMKALAQGWKQLWGMNDFPFYFVMIANYGLPLDTVEPVLISGGWNGDTRLQQANAMALPHAGCGSALDIGVSKESWPGYHPQNKLDVGERLALWALKNDYGHPEIVASGPVLKDVAVAGTTVVCSFDHVGKGLMVGSKKWYQPTQEVPGGTLQRFVIAGADGKWVKATAVIKDNKVIMSAPSVAEPRKVSYAVWQNPEGCNLYNKEGLPAAPFHVEDVTTHYGIAASAGEGGTISPAGTASLLQRMPALYAITPDAGYCIQDVKVDGVSVGSVSTYTFDPVYSNHVIAASFAHTAPSYGISTSAGAGGGIAPGGEVSVAQGGSQAFCVVPKPGMIIKGTVIDGIEIGPRDRYTFSDARRNHSIAASFACMIAAEAGYGGSITPCGDITAGYGSNMVFAIAPIAGYAIERVVVDGKNVGTKTAYTFENITASHAIAVQFKGVSGLVGKIPRTNELILACLGESLPSGDAHAAWPAWYPAGAKLAPITSPETVKIDGRKFTRNLYLDGDGYTFNTYAEPIACKGASIVAVARPVRNGGGSGWFSILDVFYDRLVLGIRNDSGLVCVRRNGPVADSKTAIPDGQITILSLIVQPDGTYKVYANGVEIMAETSTSPMTSLVPGVAGGYAKSITIGRNAPDQWTTFNGDIGDVYLYKVALTDVERKQLEMRIAHRLSVADSQR